MIDTHLSLTLQAAVVAASAIRSVHGMAPLLGQPNGEVKGFYVALDALVLLYRPPPPRVPRPRKPSKPKAARRPQAPRLEPIVEESTDESPWDPEPLYEASRCQAFLMEIIRRATSDWVLYRQHHKLQFKALAEQAYVWLFEEEPGHPAWETRERSVFQVKDEVGMTTSEVGSRRLTSFLSICEACNLDPEAVRERAREMTVESIMRTGRHTERRPARTSTEAMSIETHSLVDVDIDQLDIELSSSQDYYESRDGYGIDHAW